MRITTTGTLTAIQPVPGITVIIGRDGQMDEDDFRPLLQQLGLDGITVTARSWDYAEADGLIVWTLMSDPRDMVGQ